MYHFKIQSNEGPLSSAALHSGALCIQPGREHKAKLAAGTDLLHEASGDFLRPTVLLVLLRNMTAVNWQMVI